MEADQIKYAMGRMEGDDVAPFTDTYRKMMSGALGYKKEISYERWFMFEPKVTERFAPTHEAERTHKLMKLEKYHGDIRQFLLRMENHNIKFELPGVAWRDMIKAQMPEAGLLRLSFETYPNDELWLAGFKNAMIQHENHKEEKRLRDGKGESLGTSISRKMEDRALTKSNTRPPKRYTAEKRAAYVGKPKAPRKKKEWSKEKTATNKKEVVHTDWDKAHDTIRKDVIDPRRNNKGCTRCGMTNHISKKTIYVRRTQPASGRIASTLCVPCALTVRRTFFLIPCAWCLTTPLSPLPCTQRACCGRPLSRHPPHPSPHLLLSSEGIRRTHPQIPAPGPPAPYLLPLAT